jgi:intein/homing endonuclease
MVGMDRGNEIHPVILSATRSQTIEYLRGLWDTDGHINTQGSLYLPQKVAKAKLLQQVQLLMFDLGIESTLGFSSSPLKGKRFPRATITISSRKGRETFLDLIGFTEPHKQERLRGFVQNRKDAPRKISGVVWPLGELFSKVVSEHVFEPSRKVKVAIRKWRKHGTPISDGAMQEVLQLTRFNTTGDEDLTRLWSFTRFRPTLVQSVTEMPPARVFDLEVSGDHEYATGPFFSHNCERSGRSNYYLPQR